MKAIAAVQPRNHISELLDIAYLSLLLVNIEEIQSSLSEIYDKIQFIRPDNDGYIVFSVMQNYFLFESFIIYKRRYSLQVQKTARLNFIKQSISIVNENFKLKNKCRDGPTIFMGCKLNQL